MRNVLLNITKVLLISTGFVTASCAGIQSVIINVEPTIQEHIDTYFIEKLKELDSNKPSHAIEFKFADLDDTRLGACRFHRDPTRPRVVEIDHEKWLGASNSRREQLVFHELGHCDLGILHTKAGIMRANQLQDSFYVSNRDILVHELFNLKDVPRFNLKGHKH